MDFLQRGGWRYCRYCTVCVCLADHGSTSVFVVASLGSCWRSTWWTWTSRASCTARAWPLSYARSLARPAGRGSEIDPALRYTHTHTNTHTYTQGLHIYEHIERLLYEWCMDAVAFSHLCLCLCLSLSLCLCLSVSFFSQLVDNQFILSFTHRLLEVRGATTYFSFCYPFSYTESQELLQQLDEKYTSTAALNPRRYTHTHIYTHTHTHAHTQTRTQLSLNHFGWKCLQNE